MQQNMQKIGDSKMLKDLSIDNWILAGTGFLIVFTVGCFFWYQNLMAQLQPVNDDSNHNTIQVEKANQDLKNDVIETNQEEDTDSHSTNFDVPSHVSTTRQENTQNINTQQSRREVLRVRILL